MVRHPCTASPSRPNSPAFRRRRCGSSRAKASSPRPGPRAAPVATARTTDLRDDGVNLAGIARVLDLEDINQGLRDQLDADQD
jgi:hypothetical protein